MNRTTLKRLALITLFILLIVGILVVVWFLFFAPFFRPTQPGGNANENVNGGALPNVNANRPVNTNANPVAQGPGTLPKPAEVANGSMTLAKNVSSTATVSPIIGPDGTSIIYYDDLSEKFVRLDPATGKLTDVTTQKFPDVKNITWAPDDQRAVLEFPDNSKIVYDFQSQRQYSLPSQSQKFSFSADSDRLAYAYIGTSAESNFLVTSNADGTGSKAVAELGDQADYVQVAWSPSDQVVGLYRKGSAAGQQEIVFIGQNDENFKSLTTDGSGFQGKWTPDGTKLLYTVYSEMTNWNPELHLVYAAGDNIGQGDVDLGLQTSLDKCIFNHAGTHAYCAVPDLMERGSGLYPEFSANVKDSVYSINLTSGALSSVAQPVSSDLNRFTIGRLLLSTDESTLYFTDLSTGKVEKVRLR
ncbi:MAG: WD40 repeat domain-containing protein [bacterium]